MNTEMINDINRELGFNVELLINEQSGGDIIDTQNIITDAFIIKKDIIEFSIATNSIFLRYYINNILYKQHVYAYTMELSNFGETEQYYYLATVQQLIDIHKQFDLYEQLLSNYNKYKNIIINQFASNNGYIILDNSDVVIDIIMYKIFKKQSSKKISFISAQGNKEDWSIDQIYQYLLNK